ncbi:hypothetical protein [Hoeflea poritis]|uniref:Uncharacterized protein n=1 Tax=Hoeflea poritis TaxID=2993659 RepID=A0ABT4VQR2_9HYPH|nr:hypothetical protein [Hoeflea poritis]MDA4847016.1 hypothetical protein [Hoeflea poritis]
MNPIWKERLLRGAAATWSVLRPLLNATLLLAAIAAIAGLTLVNSTRSLVDDTMTEVKSGVLHEIDEDAKRLFQEIDAAYAEFERLEQQVAGILGDPQSLLDSQTKEDIRAVRDDLSRIAGDLDRISTGQFDISQKTLEKLAVSLVRTYGEIRGCTTQRPANP